VRTRTKLKNPPYSAGLDGDSARSAVCKRSEEEKVGRVLNVEDTVDVNTGSGRDAINEADINSGLGIREVGVGDGGRAKTASISCEHILVKRAHCTDASSAVDEMTRVQTVGLPHDIARSGKYVESGANGQGASI
jgi:hypothetical protein